jgi:hypothetical protein
MGEGREKRGGNGEGKGGRGEGDREGRGRRGGRKGRGVQFLESALINNCCTRMLLTGCQLHSLKRVYLYDLLPLITFWVAVSTNVFGDSLHDIWIQHPENP